MKKAGIGIAVIAILLGAGKLLLSKSPHSANQNLVSRGKSNFAKATSGKQITKNKIAPSPTSHSPQVTSQSLFIPYWSSTFTEKDLEYDNYYYFGIRPTASGKIENEIGLSNMPKVAENLKLKDKSQKKVVIRMLDATVTEALLTDEGSQKTLIHELQTILTEFSFTGIVLDLEVPFTLKPEKKGQITKFVQQICSSIKSNYRTCDFLIYGDYSYRNRPYDIKSIGNNVDRVLLMAYDFHKAGGEPGPNFSFNEKEKYGYDFKKMISDTLVLVPKDKVEVVFGMYGYDWTLNEQGTPLKSAEALSLNSIKLKAERLKLKVESNNAKEKYIHYIDSEGSNHIIWYEDEESVAIKTKYLLEQGVSQVSYWAYGYF